MGGANGRRPVPVAAVICGVLAAACAGTRADELTDTALAFLPAPALALSGEAKAIGVDSASGSSWHAGFCERRVQFGGLAYRPEQPDGWELRVGKGGQIYSLRCAAGETVPPQKHDAAPWVDEVWQAVAVCSEKNGRSPRGRPADAAAYFIHGSGIYLRDPQRPKPFYNPVLLVERKSNSLTMVNWLQQAHVPSPHRSGVLCYARFAALQNGALEVTYVLLNFGPDTLDFLNLPWGGVRSSVFPYKDVTGAQQGKAGRDRFGRTPTVPLARTQGFALFSRPDRTGAMAWVYGRHEDTGGIKALLRWGYAGVPDRASPRDYFVTSLIARTALKPGEALLRRYFFVFGSEDHIRRVGAEMVGHARLQRLELTEDTAPTDGTAEARLRETLGIEGLRFRHGPVCGWLPLFHIYLRNRKEPVLTTDPYAGLSSKDARGRTVYRAYDGRITRWTLKGFVDRPVPAPSTPRDNSTLDVEHSALHSRLRPSNAEHRTSSPPPPASAGAESDFLSLTGSLLCSWRLSAARCSGSTSAARSTGRTVAFRRATGCC